MSVETSFDIDTRFRSYDKILAQREWLDKYRRGEKVYPICWEIDVSNRCPYHCEHCCWGNYIEGHGEIIPKDKLFHLVDEVKSLGGKSIIWSGGGDPLTNPSIVEVIDRASSLGIESGMFTNGLGMNQGRAEVLSKSLSWVRFHVGGDNAKDFARVHGVSEKYFEIATANIENFCRTLGRTASVGIGVPVNPENFDGCKGLPELSMKLGADFFQAKLDLMRLKDFEYSEWWYEVAVPYFAEEKKRLEGRVRYFSNTEQSPIMPKYCHAHRIITAITADGRVAFCKSTRDNKDTSLGNIYDQSLQEIMDGERHRVLAGEINLDTCEVAQIHCPYRKTTQVVDMWLKDRSKFGDSSVHQDFPNFF